MPEFDFLPKLEFALIEKAQQRAIDLEALFTSRFPLSRALS